MTEDQRRQALALCDRILETAAKLQADLQQTKKEIELESRQIEPDRAYNPLPRY